MTDLPLHAWSARRLADAVGRREVTAAEVVEAHLARLAATETDAPGSPRLGAWLETFADDARGEAVALDERLATAASGGAPPSLPLAGVPLAVKDNLSLAGHPLTAGSAILQGYVAPFTATAVARLRAAGAIPLGRTNLDELAMGSSTETSAFHPTRNPWHRERVPGGSSGGSAVAVAAGSAPLALGSDTGGSVRQPAAFCGVVGVRPTWGRVSRHGLMAFASSLDAVGPLARNVLDAARALALMAGPDPCDATCARRPVPDYESGAAAVAERLAGRRVGVVRELEAVPLEAADRDAWSATLEILRRLGCDLVEVSVPDLGAAVAAYQVLSAAEASTNLGRLDGARYGARAPVEKGATVDDLYRASRSRGFGAEVRRRILLGTFALSAGQRDRYYGRARATGWRLRRQLEAALGRTVEGGGSGKDGQAGGLLVTPTTPGGAFRLGERLDDPVAMYRSDVLTAPASLAGLPAVAVPAGRDGDGLPRSLQVIGSAFGETEALGLALAFEGQVGWKVEPAERDF